MGSRVAGAAPGLHILGSVEGTKSSGDFKAAYGILESIRDCSGGLNPLGGRLIVGLESRVRALLPQETSRREEILVAKFHPSGA